MSSTQSGKWKLVEAVVENPPEETVVENKSNKRRFPRRNTKKQKEFSEMNQNEKNNVLSYVVDQIEAIFSENSLCMDTFIRSYMDCEGFVPLALVCYYPNVAACGVYVSEILEYLMTVESSFIVDPNFQTIKLKEKWQRWLMPNESGTFGLPLYSTQVILSEDFYSCLEYPEEGVYEDPATAPVQEKTEKPLSVLSADASEFKPSKQI